MRNRWVTAFLSLTIVVVTACSTGGRASPSATAPASVAPASPTPVATSAAPSATATQAASASATASASTGGVTPECTKAALPTLAAGKLTLGADNPAYPPYYDPDPADPAWELGNPNNGKGLEGATAYAVAKALGYDKPDVTWVPAPFLTALQPGKKAFDFYLTQVGYSAERAQAVDLSDGYFDVNQAVVTLKENAIAKATKFNDLRPYRFGTQVGTTSYKFIIDEIQPRDPPRAYDSMDAAIAGLKAKQIDAIIADLPTAFYMRDAQLDGKGVIVGSLAQAGPVEHFSILLTKGSALTTCVNQAIAVIKADGTLKAITDEWIVNQGAPVLPG